MKINHIAIYVKDLEKSKEFYIKYFGAKSNEKYINSKTGLETYFLSFDDNTRLEIMNLPYCLDVSKNLYRLGFNHLAFSVGSKENVDNLTQRLKNDGFRIVSNPRITGDGYYESSFFDLEDNLIEIVE